MPSEGSKLWHQPVGPALSLWLNRVGWTWERASCKNLRVPSAKVGLEAFLTSWGAVCTVYIPLCCGTEGLPGILRRQNSLDPPGGRTEATVILQPALCGRPDMQHTHPSHPCSLASGVTVQARVSCLQTPCSCHLGQVPFLPRWPPPECGQAGRGHLEMVSELSGFSD